MNKEISDYEIHPIRLPPYSPIRNWNTNSFNSISPSHLKAADSHTSSAALSPVPSPALSPPAPSAKISPKPKPQNKSKGKEIDPNDTIELTIEDFPPLPIETKKRGSKPKSSAKPKKGNSSKATEPKKSGNPNRKSKPNKKKKSVASDSADHDEPGSRCYGTRSATKDVVAEV
ncbi:hypothetical protein DFH07DRAFT_785784 [Mycena maculata]|uniref:Uncharacterized protein n=1 Tax=Mycena maculata TaxID=230809 RepID=A0AAD7H7N1_9AGAR|nr:hypothetical protein DFH07DRAFT_785784 [Mycena maculata]